MPRTRAQRRATGLLALGDDPLRCALTFLSVSDCARGPGATSKAMREEVSSKRLMTARTSGDYVLRPSDNGVVHALATAMGTRRWATRCVRRHEGDREGTIAVTNAAAVPPSRLNIIARRLKIHADGSPWSDEELGRADEEPYASFFASSVVDQSQSIRCDGGRECGLDAGSYIGYEIPFSLRLSLKGSSQWVDLGQAFTDQGYTAPSSLADAHMLLYDQVLPAGAPKWLAVDERQTHLTQLVRKTINGTSRKLFEDNSSETFIRRVVNKILRSTTILEPLETHIHRAVHRHVRNIYPRLSW